MAYQVSMKKFFTIPVHELYSYFTDARLLEKWCAPDGMTLKVPLFEEQNGGRYRYEHQSPKGLYICEGHIRRIKENEMMRMVDDEIRNPKGELIAEKISSDISFIPVGQGSEVMIVQRGFPSAEFANECEEGWQQCFMKLQELVKDSGPHQFKSENEIPSFKNS